MSQVSETPGAQLLSVVDLTGLDQPESLLQHLQPLRPTSSTHTAHLLNDGLLHQRDQPGQHQSVGQLNDAETWGELHRRRLVSVKIVQELLECWTKDFKIKLKIKMFKSLNSPSYSREFHNSGRTLNKVVWEHGVHHVASKSFLMKNIFLQKRNIFSDLAMRRGLCAGRVPSSSLKRMSEKRPVVKQPSVRLLPTNWNYKKKYN